ncbi:MAG: methylated-DNA--[protein]-cysteine S-methyltransferase [Pseudohongiellaceae bacterium]
MTHANTSSKHYQVIETALEYLASSHQEQPTLTELAGHVGLSEFYLQRLFSEWVGISPKRFLQFLSREYIKTRLDQQASCLDATFDAGLSSTSRLHDLFIETESITPAQYRSLGKDLCIHYAFHDSPFGEYLLGITARGICHMSFVFPDRETVLENFRQDWCCATLEPDSRKTLPYHQHIFNQQFNNGNKIHLLLKGTNFQIKVWEALLALQPGDLCSYESVARHIHAPQATRAAASAIARNRIALLISCHRVVRKIGETGEYRWGKNRKKIMLAYEASVRSE